MAVQNVVFVVDVDYGQDTDRSTVLKRGILQILLHLGQRHGLDKLRWGYKLFSSRFSRSSGVLSRGSDFKELQRKAFQDLETDLDSRSSRSSSQRKSLSCPSASVQTALKETLLDFQWDRPDITSPTKPSLRARRAGRSAPPQLEDGGGDGRNLLLLMSECPRSAEQMEQYLWSTAGGPAAGGPTDVSEKLLCRSLREIMVQRKVTLHWIDTASHQQVVSCEDHSGADRLSLLLSPLGGRLLPLSSLLELSVSGSELGPWFYSVWGFLLSPESSYRLNFPVTRATVVLQQEGAVKRCHLQVEPVSSSQRPLSSIEVQLKTVIQEQDSESLSERFKSGSEVWVVHSPDQDWFREILSQLKLRGLTMAAEVCEDSLSRSALLRPLSRHSALLSLLSPEPPEHHPLEDLPVSYTEPEELPEELPEVVSSVLGVVYDIMEEDGYSEAADSPPVPEWALQELSQTQCKSAFVQSWFPQSDVSGSSTNLMENLRLLSAVPEDSSGDSAEQEFLNDLSELYQSSTSNRQRQKSGARRTPIKQKMKSMSRSLQMLNTARLNVKAQRIQSDPEQSGAEKQKRRSDDRVRDVEHSFSFSSEAELLQFLKDTYSRTVSEQSLSVSSGVQLLLSALRFHFRKDSEVQQSELVQTELLKSSRFIRQKYSSSSTDAEHKTRECQLQSLLRLETCRLLSSVASQSLDTQQTAEEVAEMLRIISLTKDPVFLSQFLQDQLLVPQFLSSIPCVLADVYHSLGSQLPECLTALLPSDFFSDDSVNKESPAEDPASAASAASAAGDERLQELRERSAANRRSGRLTRHCSLTESHQRQIEVQLPKRSRPAAKCKQSKAAEEPAPEPKPLTQEVTKVRRNLFNQESVSPPKRNKLPRSRSVSAVDGLRRKRSSDADDHHKLLTKKVCETPLHKQVSQRLLHRQKIGRKSTSSEQCIVEESPLKPTEDVRRSPRLKHFTSRRHSFYSSSQTRSRNVERALSSLQLSVSLCDVDVNMVRSPVRLLFGATQSPHRSPHRSPRPSPHRSPRRSPRRSLRSSPRRGRRSPRTHRQEDTRPRLSTSSSVFESPNKTPTTSPDGRVLNGKTSPKTPPGTGRTYSESPALNTRNSPFRSPSRRPNPFQSPSRTPALLETPYKISPLKSILKTPVKNSPTPKKTVTWSPTPHAYGGSLFKVPESPNLKTFKLRTPEKSSPKVEQLKMPDKVPSYVFGCQVSLVKLPENVQTPNKNEVFKTPPSQKKNVPVSPTLHMATRSSRSLSFRTPEKQDLAQQIKEKSPRTRQRQANPSPEENLKTVEEFSSPERSSGIKTPIKARREAKVSLNFESDRGKKRLTRSNSNLQSSQEFASCSLQVPGDSAEENLCTEESKETIGKSVSESNLLPEQSAVLQNIRNGNLNAEIDKIAPKAKKSKKARSENSLQEKKEVKHWKPKSRSNEEISLNLDQDKTIDKKQLVKSNFPKKRSKDDVLNQGTKVLLQETSPRLDESKEEKVTEANKNKCSKDNISTNSSQNDTDSSLQLASTDEDSLDIINASVVKADGLKMNISFSRKPSKTGDAFLADVSSPKSSSRSYGFRQTPDRRQREAAIRLGYANEPPTRFSTPRGISKKDNCLNYEVQMELQSSGLPKLKLKRTDSNSGSPLVSRKNKVEAGYVSPSTCTHQTPAKGGKSGQTFICQSYTPTHGQTSPAALTPSPQSSGKLTPDYLNSWPRRKRVKVREEAPSKERRVDKEQAKRHSTEEDEAAAAALECELGVSRLPDAEDEQRTSPGLTWIDEAWSGDRTSETPPSSRKRKPVTVSGILALTSSPLLFKTSSKTNPDCTGDSGCDPEVSPFGKPLRRSSVKTYSRKRLLP